MLEDERNTLWKYTFVQAIFTCIIMFSVFMVMFENLIITWRRWRFNRAKMVCLDYGYFNSKKNGPKCWKKLYPCCDGENQSPINIVTSMTTCVCSSDPLTWKNLEKKSQKMIMMNTGTTVILSSGGRYYEKQLSISGGSLEERSYTFKEIYFRWGERNNEGSEHLVNRVRYPLEIQLRFTDRSSSDELFVALFCKISPNDNPCLSSIVNSLNEIILPRTSTEITFRYDWLQLPFFYGYYTYPGSFTFPPCCEKVTWIVNPNPIDISAAQVEKFRELRNTNGRILSNSRPVQSLKSRTVFFYEDSTDICNKS